MRSVKVFLASLMLLPGHAAPASLAPPLEELELHSRIYGNTRTLHVLLPPSYAYPARRSTRYPVCYFNDGRAAFDPNGWDVAGAFARLWAAHEIPEVIVVAIDNGGSTRESQHPGVDRASEFLPYADQSWTELPAPIPMGDRQPAFLFTEVQPLVRQRYRVADGPIACFGGASYGAIAALYVGLQAPDSITALLLESPSLHIGNGRLLREAERSPRRPRCTYLGVGTAEGATKAIQSEVLRNATALSAALPAMTSRLSVTPQAEHSYDAWRARLPDALRFLFGERCRAAAP